MRFNKIDRNIITITSGAGESAGVLLLDQNADPGFWYYVGGTSAMVTAPELREIANHIEGENLDLAIHAMKHPCAH